MIVGINPQTPGTPTGAPAAYKGVASLHADVARLDARLRGLEANRTVIGTNAISGGMIGAGTITAANIEAGSIDASVINAGSIAAAVGSFISLNADQIVAGDISTDRMEANVVTAVRASISDLSVISSDMGNIVAGSITGASIKTAATGSRVVMDSGGIRGYGIDGTTTVFEINTGSGIASFTGIAYLDPSSVIPGLAVNDMPGDHIVDGSISALQIAAGAITANALAVGSVRAQHISLEFGTRNQLGNSSFENGTTFWGTLNSNSTIANDTTTLTWHGLTSLKVTSSGAGDAGTATLVGGFVGGNVRKFSAYIMGATGTTTKTYDLEVGWYDTGGSLLSTDTVSYTGGVTTTGYTRITGTFTAPTGAVTAVPKIIGRSLTAGQFFYIDAVQWESTSLSDYAPRLDEVLPGNSVGATQIAPDSIISSHITADAITAREITGSTLSVIAADMGSLVAGTVTGATLRTAATGARTVMDPAGFHTYDASSNVIFDATGGTVSMVGSVTATSMNFNNISTTTPSASNSIRWFSGNFTNNFATHHAGYSSGTVSGLPYWYGLHNIVAYTFGGFSNATGFINLAVVDQGSPGDRITFSVQRDGVGGGGVYALTNTNYLFDFDMAGGFSSFDNGFCVWHFGGVADLQQVKFDNASWMFQGGHAYGGSGTAHVVLPSGSPGSSYTNGYSYALLHVDYSDEKLKHDIRDAYTEHALSRVRALRPVKYALKGGHATGSNEAGFIAQDVQAVFPEAVERLIEPTGDVTLAVNPTALIAALAGAVQELTECVNVLRGEAPDARLARDTVKSIVK